MTRSPSATVFSESRTTQWNDRISCMSRTNSSRRAFPLNAIPYRPPTKVDLARHCRPSSDITYAVYDCPKTVPERERP